MGIVRFKIKSILFRIYQRLAYIACHKSTEGNPSTLLCCIGKDENRYVREYVEWYKEIGFSHIVIYDNNDIDGERFEDVIQCFIDDGFVEIKDFRGRKVCQLEAYRDCYETNRSAFDWIAFFDMDEFLDLKQDSSIGEFLSKDIFKKYEIIHINWRCYGDNGNIRCSEGTLAERFPEPAPEDIMHSKWNCPTNGFIKSIVRCCNHLPLWWKLDSHSPFPTSLRCCRADGTRCKAEGNRDDNYDRNSPARLRHYTTKSTEEYLHKLERGYPDQIVDVKLLEEMIDKYYFDLNPDTEDRRKYLAEWMDSYLNDGGLSSESH